MPSFAELKAKAQKASEAASDRTSKFVANRQSAPSLKPGMDAAAPRAPRATEPVPSPPARSGSSSSFAHSLPPPPLRPESARASSTSSLSSAGGPPAPPRRSAKFAQPRSSPTPPPPAYRPPAAVPAAGAGAQAGGGVEVLRQNKEEFFGFLDEFFAYRGVGSARGLARTQPAAQPPSPTQPQAQAEEEADEPSPPPPPSNRPRPSGVASRFIPPPPRPAALDDEEAPPIPSSTRPSLPAQHSSSAPASPAPAPSPHDRPEICEAHLLCLFFHPSNTWTEPWFIPTNGVMDVPPPARGTHMRATSGFGQTTSSGGVAHAEWTGYVVHSDDSISWFYVAYDPADPLGHKLVRRAAYKPRPDVEPWDGGRLYREAEIYGELVAQFAESAERDGRHVGRGECWDLADQAFKHIITSHPHVPPPIGSGPKRQHGALIYRGGVDPATGAQWGEWRGGENSVRRGDIAEWCIAEIAIDQKLPDGRRVTGMQRMGAPELGMPEHTGVIVRDSPLPPHFVDSVPAALGGQVLPSDLVTLETIDQGKHILPKRSVLDLRNLKKGEMWIYRPIGKAEWYDGEEPRAQWPPPPDAVVVAV